MKIAAVLAKNTTAANMSGINVLGGVSECTIAYLHTMASRVLFLFMPEQE
jgi:hypothetical protein